MPARRGVFLVFLVMLLTSLFPNVAGSNEGTRRFVIVFRAEGLPNDTFEVVSAARGQINRRFPRVGVIVATSTNPRFAQEVERHPSVLAAGPEGFQSLRVESAVGLEDHAFLPTTADDLFVDRQWHIRRIRANEAWSVTTGSSDIVVAVIDNGIASNHPDLSENLVYSACFSSTESCNVYPDVPFASGGFHGTHVAGIVAASFGHGRVVGVGPRLSLASYNVFEMAPETGFVAFDSSVWAAMLDAVTQGFRVINLSAGGTIVFPEKEASTWTAWKRITDFVNRQGVVIVASAGNGAMDLNGSVAHIPSDLPSVIGVGATGIRPSPAFPVPGAFDVRAFYSNFGSPVTLVAPGGDCGPANPMCMPPVSGTCAPPALTQSCFWIQSTGVLPGMILIPPSPVPVPAPGCIATASCAVVYVRTIGTSQAAPHVAGVAGLILSQNPGLQPHQVAAILKRTAQDLGNRQQFGHGMVDAAAAVGLP